MVCGVNCGNPLCGRTNDSVCFLASIYKLCSTKEIKGEKYKKFCKDLRNGNYLQFHYFKLSLLSLLFIGNAREYVKTYGKVFNRYR